MKFRPTEDRVLVRPDPVEEETATGLIIVQSDTDSSPTTGVIVAIGPGRMRAINNAPKGFFAPEPMMLSVGDRVTWSKFAGTTITVDGEELLLMRASDIAGVLS